MKMGPPKKKTDVIADVLLFLALIGVALIYLPLNRARIPLHSLRTPWDDAIPFVSIFAVPYLSLYLLTGLTLLVAVLGKRRKYRDTVVTMTSVLLISYVVFWQWQTIVVRPDIVSSDLFSRLVAWVYSHDAPYNAFPSLHVSLSTTCALTWLRSQWPSRPLFVGWSLLVAASTVLIKQHYLADVIGGALLAAVCFAAVSALSRFLHEPSSPD